ncbi:photosynthetic complex putative assembly protein PuhB [Roseovarius aquimarinus]|uniref:Photosynthetic complex putative assembly protein PuhB n=1 Tax=Roseovarius aquimarinus TaxID=1229156 RepID=A0ABW7I2N1_9RHOB
MHDDFKFEPVKGLPEALPEGEHILWQGRPSTWRLAREAWKLNWIAGYFTLLAVWRVGVSSTQLPLGEAMTHAVPFVVIGALCCLILLGLAAISARSTVYTLTNKRVGMRIGAALTMTLNLPYTQIGSASLERKRSGHGTIAFELLGGTRLSYLMTWPHVRPWYMARTQPALRCIPNAAHVAEIFAEAAEIRTSAPQIARRPQTAIAAE